jgi:hypothetical protein
VSPGARDRRPILGTRIPQRTAAPRAAKEGPPVFDSPGFLELPERERKPWAAGLTHLLDKGAPWRC